MDQQPEDGTEKQGEEMIDPQGSVAESPESEEKQSSRANGSKAKEKKGKKAKTGVVYLSYVPQGMNVLIMRQLLSAYGDVGRVYLEPNKGTAKPGLKAQTANGYLEGWVEFRRKRDAKRVASHLNGKPVGGRRRTAFHDSLWSIRYLRRFKWNHLTEQMNYEKALRDQRLRFEMGRVKKETEFYMERVDELKVRQKKGKGGETGFEDKTKARSGLYKKKQRLTDEEIRRKKALDMDMDAEAEPGVDMELLSNIFS
jgi:ESF2/ABP1 family protein